LAEAGVCGELETDEDELVEGLQDCPQTAAEEREVGMAIVDDMMVYDKNKAWIRFGVNLLINRQTSISRCCQGWRNTSSREHETKP
jgi:hypothetical protein